MKLLRSVFAVISGYLVFAVSAVLLFQVSGAAPHAQQSVAFMRFTVAYGMMFAAVGGSLAVRIAASRPMLHAGFVAGLIALGAAISLIASPGAGSTWSQWTAILLMAPCAILGPLVAGRRRRATS